MTTKDILREPLRKLARAIGLDLRHYDASTSVRLADETREHIRLNPAYRHIHAGALGWALYVADMAQRLELDGIIDVGANRGQFHDAVRHLGVTLPIHSFEPIPELAQELSRRTATDPAWTIHAHAIGAKDEQRDLHVLADDALSSLHPANAEAAAIWSEAKTTPARTIPVHVRCLADLFAHGHPGTHLRQVFLKTDTQGGDLDVLRGCESQLHRVQAVQFEAALRPAYEGGSVYGDILPWLETRGFVLGACFPIHHEGLRLVEFDCIMIRPPAR